MALDDVLARLRSGELVTPATPPRWAGVTPKPAPATAATLVTPVTPGKTIAKSDDGAAATLTREYLISLGLEVLPEDVAFLIWHLPRDAAARNRALGKYVHRWREAMFAEPSQHRKDNAGRRAANTWLRSEVGRYR